jgi:ABC-type sugar transport system ATPase subunit
MSLLGLRHISKTFGGINALDDVSLDVDRGDILGLVGDNGAGKSTLVKILSGAHEPTSGEILLEDTPCTLAPPANAQRQGIETVYQDLALIGTFTAADNFFLGREIAWGQGPGLTRFIRRRAMAEQAVSALDELHIEIPKVRTQPVDRMSGGQRQLTAIARAAFWGTKLLLLDEPTAALGVRESREVLDLIIRLSRRGLTILMVTHNLEHLSAVCNRVVVMRRGRKVADRLTADTTMDEVVGLITGARGEADARGSRQAQGAGA